MQKKLNVAVICGGPSAERGISLNSARSLYDNLDKNKYEISIFYFNQNLEPFTITPEQVYSNTPLDFDYKLKNGNQALSNEKLKKMLKKIDLVFPAIHGLFGEDGQLQSMLEEWGINYLGSAVKACRNTSDKHLCQQILQKNGFFTTRNYVIKKGEPLPELPPGKYVIKPLHGGSSIGIQYFQTQEELREILPSVFFHEPEAIIEPFFEGTEFTVIVLQNATGEPVALYPTEIEFTESSSFFDYRKKYLASPETRYHTPARFTQSSLKKIRSEAEKAFLALGMKDFARLDGWLTKDGTIWFSDINAISGMEQNSFLFQQAALFGLSHSQLLDFIINKKLYTKSTTNRKREKIPVLFGGNTAEREVSIISGTNVWMKLKSSRKYEPIPLFMSFEKKIFRVPQFLCLHHTVEEIEEKIRLFSRADFIKSLEQKQKEIFSHLGINVKNVAEKLFKPEEISLDNIPKKYKFLFIGLHGGEGEDGTLQKKLEKLKIPFNGADTECSRLCMDKFKTGLAIQKANIPGVKVAKKLLLKLSENSGTLWKKIRKDGFTMPVILKPRGDGCSAGVIRISNFDHFNRAHEYFSGDHRYIPEKAIHAGHGQIDLPREKLTELMVEEFIETDKVHLENLAIEWEPVSDNIEVTIGVIGEKGDLHVFNPSQTIATGDILSLEEKFMGGTGINLTPPPKPYVNKKAIEKTKTNIKKIAEILGIEGYARIDTFMNRKTGELCIIEANTLPALTPSTVFYQQALAEKPPIPPLKVLEKLIELAITRHERDSIYRKNNGGL
jgi:D-alanine--D-alanine ligase